MKLLEGQLWHLLTLTILLLGVYFYVQGDTVLLSGQYLGISSKTWFVIAMLSPILHQVYVAICWRIELFNKSISNRFGKNGFTIYKIGFAFLIASRLITIILLAISSAGSLNLTSNLSYLFAAILFIPSAYLFYSVNRYFGMDRAFGIDHFYPEKLKDEPFVKKGIFKYTSNGMYIYGFMILYIAGFIWLSKAALLVALFNHAYIWVHYYFTELPDIKVIYGE